jgi:hypothetical protein
MRYDWKILAGVAAASAVIGWLVVRQPAGSPDVDDVDEIERDLTTLAQALRYDESIETYVHPPGLVDLELPGTVEYRRSVKFWEPAFPSRSRGRR